MLQSDSTQTIDYIQKCFRQKFQFLRRPSYLTTLFFYRWRRLSYFKVNSTFLNGTMYFFSMTLLPTLRRIQRPTTQGYFNHTKYENSRKIETYRIKPLKEVKQKIKKCVTIEFDNEENEHWTKFVLWRVRQLWFSKDSILSDADIFRVNIDPEYRVPFKKVELTAFSNSETFVWNIFGYDPKFECYHSVTLYVPDPVRWNTHCIMNINYIIKIIKIN